MQRIALYAPHPAQWMVHSSPARFRVATTGRRFGKTVLCINEIAKFAWEHQNAMTWWVAPIYRQSEIAFRTLTYRFRKALADVSRSHMRIRWKSGSYTEFRSAETYENLRGEGVHFLVIDEAARVHKRAWEEVLRPMLVDTRGRAIFVSTPKGMGDWFHQIWLRGQDPLFPDYASWQLPTVANTTIPGIVEEVEEAQRTLPEEVFRQEYTAAFIEGGGAVFSNLNACTKGEFEEPRTDRGYVIGWDPAKHEDASVVVVFDTITRHVVAFDRFLRVDYTLQLARVEALARKYQNARVLMDSTGVGDPLLEALQGRGLFAEGYVFTNASKQQLVEHLAVRFQAADISMPPIPVLRGELETFQYELTRAGNIKYAAPEGYKDDAVCALALAVWAGCHGGGLLQQMRIEYEALQVRQEREGVLGGALSVFEHLNRGANGG